MGCDGGSIPKRAELVRTKTKEAALEKSVKTDLWRYCCLSKEPLVPPVVTCPLGKLYSREAVLEMMLARSSGTLSHDPIPHIKSTKHLHNLRLTPNPAYQPRGPLEVRQAADEGTAPFICPVTGREMNGNFAFVYLKGCGCVISEQALSSVPVKSCLKCGRSREIDDVAILKPDAILPPSTNISSSSPSSSFRKKRPNKSDKSTPANTAESLNVHTEIIDPMSGRSIFKKTKAISTLYNHTSTKT